MDSLNSERVGRDPLNPFMVGLIVFAFTRGGALIGNGLRARLPEHHLDDESRDTVDRLLARYGPEAAEIRSALKRAVADRIDALSPENSSRRTELDPIRSGAAAGAENLAEAIQRLTPRDDSQRSLQSHARELDGPFDGFIRASVEPLRYPHSNMNQ
jgi:hypothetical protein